MNTAKVYKDMEGNECTIWQMVKKEPEWAANRIQAGEDAIAELATLRAKLTDEERKNTNLRHGLEEMEREKSAAYCKGYNEGLAYVRAALAEMTERARKLGEALTYIAGSVGARDHERRIAREALEAITAREVVKE